eukprot:tig00020607_g11916.t1
MYSAYDVLHRSRDGVPERYEATELKSRSPAAAWNRWHADRARGAGAGPRMHMPAQQRQLQPQTIRVTVSPPMAAPPPLGSAVMVRVVRVAERAAAARSGLRPSYANVPAFPSEALPAFLARSAPRPAAPALPPCATERAGWPSGSGAAGAPDAGEALRGGRRGAAEIAETAALLAVGSDLVIYAAPGTCCPARPRRPAPPRPPPPLGPAPRPRPSGPGSGSGSSGSSALSGSASAASGPGAPPAPPHRASRGHPREISGRLPPGPAPLLSPAVLPAPTARRVRLSPLAASAPGALPPSSACLTYAPPSTHVLPPPLLLPAAPEAAAGGALALASPAPSALSGRRTRRRRGAR